MGDGKHYLMATIDSGATLFACYMHKREKTKVFYLQALSPGDKRLIRLRRRVNSMRDMMYGFWSLTLNNDHLRKKEYCSTDMRAFVDRMSKQLLRNAKKIIGPNKVRARRWEKISHLRMVRYLTAIRVWRNFKWIWKYEEGDDSYEDYPEDLKVYKDSRPHFHLMTNVFFDASQIERLWGKGFVKVRRIYDRKGMKLYLSKYFEKRTGLFHYLGGKQWGHSRTIPPAGKSDWSYCGLKDLEETLKWMGDDEKPSISLKEILNLKECWEDSPQDFQTLYRIKQKYEGVKNNTRGFTLLASSDER